MTPEQQLLVASHLHLVDTVIRTRIQTDENTVGLSYEDIRQEGCILLCNAVQTHNPNIAQLSTYATKVIYNGLISHCRSVKRYQTTTSSLPLTQMADRLEIAQDKVAADQMESIELESLLDTYLQQYCGVTRLGIEALVMKANGMGVTEIARLYQVPPSHVGAWITRAKKQLKNNRQFLDDIA